MGNYTDMKRSRRSRRGRARTQGVRSQRLEELIREEMNALLEFEVTDPSLDGVRITTVSLSPDAARARAFYTMGHSNTVMTSVDTDVDTSLRRATAFFRREICDALALKRTPELRFEPDLPALADDGTEEIF
jgi:ribosome-binding factor A